jgi:glycosyltransferase involved in cell wall biosynthesis
MKRLLYIAPVIIDFEKLNGVAKKVLNHNKIFTKFYNVEMVSYGPNCLYYFHDNEIETIDLNKLGRRIRLYKFIIDLSAKDKKYNFIYSRYHLSDYLFIYILGILSKITNKIVIEIPTYPYRKELLKSKNGLIRLLIDLTSRSFLRFYVGRVVTYSNDANIFGIKAINTCNGIIYDDINKSQKLIHTETEINLISVSVTTICHGYDRIIEGIYNYYKNGGNINLVYHLVGDGEEIKLYQELIEQYKLENNVKLYGFKGGQELDEIYDKADIAIDSLGIHRIGLVTESTLKAKEYAAKGLPIISTNEIDVFTQDENDKFVFRVPADESAVDVVSLIQFYKQIYFNDIIDVSDEIRKASQKRCDMIITLQGVIEYFNANVEIEK